MTIGGAQPVLVQTQLVGGPAIPFDDANKAASWPTKAGFLADFPIQQIVVRSGWILDGLTITYRMADGKLSPPQVHGGTGGAADTITLSPTEIVVSVQGKAGMHSYYKRPYVCLVFFTILDTKTLTTRVTKTYGNSDNTNQGNPFEVAQPYAFAGAAYTDGQSGIAGLSFFKLLTNV